MAKAFMLIGILRRARL